MTKQEWLIHILNGGKGTSNLTAKGEYINFKNDRFLYKDSSLVKLELHKSNFAVYEEPKKKIKVAPYIYKISENDRYVQTWSFFKDDMTFLKIYQDENLKFQRLTALEIEVEDYEQN